MTANPSQLHTVIVGVGNELRGDDAVGIEVVRRLQEYALPHVTLFDTGTVPENFLGPIVSAQPDHVIIIDAAEMNEFPGTICELDGTALDWSTFSTHMNVLKLVMDFIEQETAANIRLIGVQPSSHQFGDTLSTPVMESIDTLTQQLVAQLSTPATSDR